MLPILAAIAMTLFTAFMVFLTWLAKDSKDKFAFYLRVLGWIATVSGWTLWFAFIRFW